MPLWRVVSNLSALSYQLSFRPTVAFLPQFFILRRCRFIQRAFLPLRRHQCRLEDDRGRERRQQRQGHQFAHARRPGWCENHRLPKAVAVVQALKKTARVRLDCRKLCSPARHAMT